MSQRPGPAASALRVAAALAGAALLVTAACRGGAPGGGDEIKVLVAKQVEAINARDMQALSRIWSQQDDILLFDVAPPGRFHGWPEIARSFNGLFEKASDLKMTVENLQVQEAGTLATATYDWSMTGKVGESALEDHGQATEIYRHEKDGWKLMHAHYSAAPAAAAPAESKPSGAARPSAASKPAAAGKAPAAPKPPAAPRSPATTKPQATGKPPAAHK
jgi:ketosteroid isomerase-like protein